MYVGRLNVALNNNGKYTYDITNIDEVTNKKEHLYNESSTKSERRIGTSALSDTVSASSAAIGGTDYTNTVSDTNTITQNQDSVKKRPSGR